MDEESELPEFLRFNRYGAVLTLEDRKRVAESRGVCIHCGRTTHKVTAFRSKPLDNEHVHHGICLACHPEERRAAAILAASSRSNGDEKNRSQKLRGMKNVFSRSLAKSSTLSVEETSQHAAVHVDTVEPQPQHASRQSSDLSDSDAWDILRSMRRNPDNVALLARKCNQLRSFGSNLETGTMYEIVDVVKRFPDEREVVLAGIGALWALVAEGGDDAKIEAIGADVARVILRALRDGADDADLVSWGMGTLSCLAESIGGRDRLLKEDLVGGIESILVKYHGSNAADTCVLYWTFRCLTALLAVYKEHEEYVSRGNFDDDNDMLEDLEAVDDYKEAIFMGEIVHYVLLALKNIGSECLTHMNCLILQMGFEFLVQLFSNMFRGFQGEEHRLLLQVCEKTVSVEMNGLFPTLQNISCAYLCFILNAGRSERPFTNDKTAGWTHGFLKVARDVLRVKNCKDIVVRDVMMCTLSQTFFWEHAFVDFAHRNSILRFCIASMAAEQKSEFCLETCLWIMWGILSGEDNNRPKKSLVSQATELVKNAISENEDRPNIIILGLAMLSDIETLHVIRDVDSLIPRIFYLKRKYRENEILNAEANNFLNNICTTRDIAALIENTYAETDLSIMSSSTSIDLIYNISVLTGNCEFSLDDLREAVKAWHESDRDIHLAAKILFLLNAKANVYIKSIEKARNILSVKAQTSKWSTFVTLAIKYVKDVLESTTSVDLQQYACVTLGHVAVLGHKLTLDSLDISVTLGAIVRAQHIGVSQLKAIWALLTLDYQLRPSLLNDLSSCTINALEHLGSDTDVASAGVAVLSIISLRSRPLLQVLDEKTVHRSIEAVIRVMYECLDQTGNNPQIIMFGLHMLRICSGYASLHDTIVKHGGIVAVIDGMAVNHDDVEIQKDGCKILCSLSSIDLETKIGLIEADAVDAILNILTTHGDTNASLLSDAFEILSYLCISKQSRAFIASQGGLILITNSMRALCQDANVQEKGLRALANLASDIDDKIIEMLDLSFTIMSSLGNHLTHLNIQNVGLCLLRNLSLRSNVIKDQLLNSGCLEAVITALTVHMVRTPLLTPSLSSRWVKHPLLSLFGRSFRVSQSIYLTHQNGFSTVFRLEQKSYYPVYLYSPIYQVKINAHVVSARAINCC
ncbi:hypothetical protein ACHAWX_005878 [Stephanocyclus meneghinianus]